MANATSVNALIQLLAEEQDFTSVEIAETLWLAKVMEPTIAVVHEKILETTPVTPIVDISSLPPIEPPDFDPPSAPAPRPKANLAMPRSQVGMLPPEVLPVWVGDPAMLTDELAIVRALKPLLRKVAVGRGTKLDETATVDRIGRTGLYVPVMEPERLPWFDIVLVIDRGASMQIWHRLVLDIVRVLRCYGTFRDVRVYDLAVDASVGEKLDRVTLKGKGDRPGHHPSEVIDQQGRRVVMVLSDCAGAYWWDGTLLPILEEWGKAMPTVVWQMLPAWMWKRTALGRGTGVSIRNAVPGGNNHQFQAQVQERHEPEDKSQRISVPVVTVDDRDLARWSRMVAGDGRSVVPGVLLPARGGVVPRGKKLEEIAEEEAQRNVDQGDDADLDTAFRQAVNRLVEQRVQRFLELGSPQAKRLIMLLAAAPVITLPMVRLIREAMMVDARSPLPVAEVFLSGLISRVAGQETIAVTELEQVQYDFAVGVRAVLAARLPTIETIEVINCVSDAVERRWNRVSQVDFRAFLMNPNLAGVEDLGVEAIEGFRSFASVTADLLEPLGGEYANFAQQLRHGEEETDIPEPIDFPELQDCEYQSIAITEILELFEFETATIKRQLRQQQSRLGGRSSVFTHMPARKRPWKIDRITASAWGYTEILHRAAPQPPILEEQEFPKPPELGVGGGSPETLEMIAIPSGTFTMGAPKKETNSRDSERPTHEVTVQSFYMGRHQVTQAQWRVVAGYPQIDRELNPDPSDFKGDNLPVKKVNWDDTQEFCNRLSAHTGKIYRLPSEAEWEYACRAGTTTAFHFGETIAPELANYDASEVYNDSPKGDWRQETIDVGNFPANAWGLYDMHGNVWEWCEDDWHPDYNDAPKDGSVWVESDRKTALKLLRGGSWFYDPMDCRSALRVNDSREGQNSNVGFRVSCAFGVASSR